MITIEHSSIVTPAKVNVSEITKRNYHYGKMTVEAYAKYVNRASDLECFLNEMVRDNLKPQKERTELTQRNFTYGKMAVEAYAKYVNRASDLEYFLNAMVKENLKLQKGKTIFDAGCGAAPWSVYSAKQGARKVLAVDIQQRFVELAQLNVNRANVSEQVVVRRGDITRLPDALSNTFDHVISINVACNLPPDVFVNHFKEVARVLSNNNTALIAAPYSLDVIFSDGSNSDEEIHKRIVLVLSKLPDNPSDEQIKNSLNTLHEIVSATFTVRNNRLILVSNESQLIRGQKIWRKLHSVTIPNYYYSQKDYLSAFNFSKLKITKVEQRCFNSEAQMVEFNSQELNFPKLGKAYIHNAPFILYHIKKDADVILTKNI